MSRRRFGSVRRAASGRWQARYKGPDGRERQADRTFATKTDAARYLDAVAADQDRGVWSDPRSRSMTLSSYSVDWLSHRKLAPRTRELYADLLRLHIGPQLGQHPLAKITPAEVRRWHSARLNSTGPVRTRQAYSLLRTICGTAVRDGHLPTNPCQIPGAGQVRSPERPYLSREQADALAAAMPPDMRAIVVLTLWAHLRLGELLALRREDVDLVAGTVHIHRQIVRLKEGPLETATKTQRGRVIALPTQALEELRRHLAATAPALPSARLFVHRSGKPLARQHVGVAWSRARADVGLSHVHFHDLRHAGLTYVAQTGASLKEIMHRGGHSTVTAAMTYQHAASKRDADIAARLSDDRSEAQGVRRPGS